MTSLGIILIGTGLIVFLSGRSMIRGTNRMLQKTRSNVMDEIDEVKITQTEREFSGIVKKAMFVLYIVGITCILIGVVLLVFSRV